MSMTIIYRGGYDKTNPVSLKNSVWFAYSKYIKNLVKEGKKVAIVTLAKEDDHKYDDRIKEQDLENVDIINSAFKNIHWSVYDAIFLLGGDPLLLYNRLVERNFSLSILKNHIFLLGDSAGAMVLGKVFVVSDRIDELVFKNGFLKDKNFFILPHSNNSKYGGNFFFRLIVTTLARLKGLKVIALRENEEFKYVR